MTGLYGQLLRRLWLVVACLTLALAPVAPSPIEARDASALSISSARTVDATRSRATSAATAHRAVPPEPAEFESETAIPRACERGAPRNDQRYLYLELLTLLS